MRFIAKGQEPRSLSAHRSANVGATYANIDKDTRSEMLSSLCAEQGFLCAYCMRRITADNDGMQVEHYQPQSLDPGLELIWLNMLGVCNVTRGRPASQATCDVARGNTELTLDPRQQQIAMQVRFELGTGRVCAANAQQQPELEGVLNLNVAELCDARRQALQAFTDTMYAEYHQPTWTQSQMEKVLRAFRGDGKPKLAPFVGIVEWWVSKRS